MDLDSRYQPLMLTVVACVLVEHWSKWHFDGLRMPPLPTISREDKKNWLLLLSLFQHRGSMFEWRVHGFRQWQPNDVIAAHWGQALTFFFYVGYSTWCAWSGLGLAVWEEGGMTPAIFVLAWCAHQNGNDNSMSLQFQEDQPQPSDTGALPLPKDMDVGDHVHALCM